MLFSSASLDTTSGRRFGLRFLSDPVGDGVAPVFGAGRACAEAPEGEAVGVLVLLLLSMWLLLVAAETPDSSLLSPPATNSLRASATCPTPLPLSLPPLVC
jgi:hypothetical protein